MKRITILRSSATPFLHLSFLFSFCLKAQTISDEAYQKRRLENVNCLKGLKDKHNINDIYPPSQCDNQGDGGTCAGYASVNALEAAVFRYDRDKLNKTGSQLKVKPLLSEAFYMMAFVKYAESNPKEILNRFKTSLNDKEYRLIDGAYTSSFLYHLVEAIKANPKMAFETKEGLADSKKTFEATDIFLRQKYKQLKNDPQKFLELMKAKLKEEANKLITKHHQSSFNENFIKSLSQKSVYSTDPNKPCDKAKLVHSLLRYVCSNIPIALSGEYLKAFGEGGHAVLVTGYKRVNKKLYFLAKNSHGSNIPAEISESEICETTHADVLMAGNDPNLLLTTNPSNILREKQPNAKSIEEKFLNEQERH